MQIPKPITVNTGEDAEVRDAIDRFLLEAKYDVEKKVGRETGPSNFRIESKGLCRLVGGEPLPGNEFAHLLFYKEEIAAVVLETRTDANYIHFDFGYLFNPKSSNL